MKPWNPRDRHDPHAERRLRVEAWIVGVVVAAGYIAVGNYLWNLLFG